MIFKKHFLLLNLERDTLVLKMILCVCASVASARRSRILRTFREQLLVGSQRVLSTGACAYVHLLPYTVSP